MWEPKQTKKNILFKNHLTLILLHSSRTRSTWLCKNFGGIMQALRKKEQKTAVTQFSLTTDLLRNLHKFNLTPASKLVLLELTTHYNEDKNGSTVFPSVGYIAEVLGIGLTAAKKAINDLIKEGLIIKSKRSNVRGNYNKYVLTLKVQNTAIEPPENKLFKQPENGLFLLRTDNKEQIKEQTVQNKGGNVYSGNDKILEEYAIKHGARNIKAYVNALKMTKSAEKIINEHNKSGIHYSEKRTDLLRDMREQQRLDRTDPEECAAWVEFGKKHGIKKIL